MAQISDRSYHYLFVHNYLRDLFYDSPSFFFFQLNQEGKEFLIESITEIAVENEEADILVTDGIEFEFVDIIDNCEFAIISLPKPVVQTEALYVGALIISNKNAETSNDEFMPIFYTMELTKSAEYLLCKWTKTGRHINTMKKTNITTKQEFINLIKMDIKN